MKKTLTLTVLLAVLFVVLSGCAKNADIWYMVSSRNKAPGVGSVAKVKTANINMEYQFADNVIRFASDQELGYIVSVGEDEVVKLKPNLPSQLKPVVGSILSADVSQTTPYGLGNKVTAIEEVDGALVCHTKVAAIDEVFSVLELESAIPLVVPAGSEIKDSQGNTYETSTATISEDGELIPASKISIGKPELLCINLPGIAKKGFSGYGQLALGAILVVDISLSKFKFEVSLEPSAGVNLQVGCQYEKTLKELWGDAVKVDLFPKTTVFTGVIQVGPVTLRPYVDTYAYVNLKAKGEAWFKFSRAFSCKFGWTEEGPFYKNTSRDNSSSFLKEFSMDGKLFVSPEVEFDLGMGLWTTKLAAEIIPAVAVDVGAELELTANENSWRLNPKAFCDIYAEAKGRVLIDLFKILNLSREMTFATLNLMHWELPLLPDYHESSINVDLRKNFSPLTFDASYSLTGGLLSAFGVLQPSLLVYRGGERVKILNDNTKVSVGKEYSPKFEIQGLNQDVSYTAKAAIRFGDRYYERDGYPFSSTTPTAAITDIVQTSSDYGSFLFEGEYYDYTFKFYVRSYIRGSQNCREWGIYDPQSVHEYYPNELVDGDVVQYWTGWSDNSYATWTKTPYAILNTGETKYYEPHTHTCTYGGGGSVSYAVKPMAAMPGPSMVARLDSVRIGHRVIRY